MKNIVMLNYAGVVALALLVSGLPRLALAQSGSMPRAEQKAPVETEDLKAFAKVYVEYHELQREYGPKIQTAKDPQEKETLQKEATSKLATALRRHDMTADRYNQIFSAVNKDKTLRDKVLNMIAAERKKS